jgi:hypothetical protein
MKEIGAADRHEVGGRLNNRAENSHQPFRRQERAMQRFRSMKTLQIVNAQAISLEDAPKGYAEFDKGIAAKFVLDPHGMLAQAA